MTYTTKYFKRETKCEMPFKKLEKLEKIIKKEKLELKAVHR